MRPLILDLDGLWGSRHGPSCLWVSTLGTEHRLSPQLCPHQLKTALRWTLSLSHPHTDLVDPPSADVLPPHYPGCLSLLSLTCLMRTDCNFLGCAAQLHFLPMVCPQTVLHNTEIPIFLLILFPHLKSFHSPLELSRIKFKLFHLAQEAFCNLVSFCSFSLIAF